MNKRRFLTLTVTAILLLPIAGLTYAKGPDLEGTLSPQAALRTAFTYQGRLTDAEGPVDGTCDLVFELYDAPGTGTPPTGGGLLGTERRAEYPIRDGAFTVLLDFGSAVFAGDARWLQVAVDCGSGLVTLSPRQQLTPSPYALYAPRAGAVPWGGLSGVPSDLADGDDTGADWSLTGNAGSMPGSHFLGTTDEVTLTLAVSSTAALRIEPNAISPNLIGGYSGNSASAGVYGAIVGGGGASGSANLVTDDYGVVGGGMNNRAGDAAGTTDDALGATVGGGRHNAADHAFATISGGGLNTAAGSAAAIGGGWKNIARGSDATVGGGQMNVAGGPASTVGGGQTNFASGPAATIGGGVGNAASGDSSTIGGGVGNVVNGDSSAIGGGYINVINETTEYATVGGGRDNVISETANFATIAGGWNNTASGSEATVGGGTENQATNNIATVGGGYLNVARGWGSTVPGGLDNEAAGYASFAAGRRAKAMHDGSFVWADESPFADFYSNGDDTYNVRSSGGFYIYTSSDLSTGMYLGAGQSNWQAVPAPSDRDLKENLVLVDSEEVLERVAALAVNTWSCKTNEDVRHMGPMAQDFYAAFGLGNDDSHIHTIDADGVALAAIQGLHAENGELEAENAELTARVDDLETRLDALERALTTGEGTNATNRAVANPFQNAVLPGAGILVVAAAVAWGARRKGGIR